MTVINPRGGATLAQVVQAALNVVGTRGVSIVTGGRGNGVQVPDELVAAVEEALGWTALEAVSTPTPATTHPTTHPTAAVQEEEPPHPPPSAPQGDPHALVPDPLLADTPVSKTSPKAAPKKAATKTTTTRRARRGKEG